MGDIVVRQSSYEINVQRLVKLFGVSRQGLAKAESKNLIPPSIRVDGNSQRRWGIWDVPKIGAHYGFLKPFKSAKAVTVFSIKGGVLKTTLAMNLARVAALNGVKVIVVGLDIQGDVTSCLGYSVDLNDVNTVQEAIDRLRMPIGLYEVYRKNVELDDVIVGTNLPTLHQIPETQDLAHLDRDIFSNEHFRASWLKENVIDPLKRKYDLIIVDCGPSWNTLTSNALHACDVLISPLECKISQFNSMQAFDVYMDQHKPLLRANYSHIFVPTRYSSTRKLSKEIRTHYLQTLANCTLHAIRESSLCEEALSQEQSVVEYKPTDAVAQEMRELVCEIWERIEGTD